MYFVSTLYTHICIQTVYALRSDMGRLDNRMDGIVNMSVNANANTKEIHQMLESLSSKLNNANDKVDRIKEICDEEKVQVDQSLNSLYARVGHVEKVAAEASVNADTANKHFTEVSRLQEIDRENLNVRFHDLSTQIRHYGMLSISVLKSTLFICLVLKYIIHNTV